MPRSFVPAVRSPARAVAGTGWCGLLQDLGDDPRPHRPAPLPHRKPLPFLQRDRRDQRRLHRHVVPRHHHLHPVRQLHVPRHVRRPKVKLRPVPREKRRVPPPLFLRQNVHFRLKLRVRVDRPRLRQHHPPLDLVLLHPPPPPPHVAPPPPPAPPPPHPPPTP